MDRAVYERMKQLQQDHWWFRGRRAVLRSLLMDIPLAAQGRILEVGCGPGANIELLRQFGEVAALEPDADCRAYVASRYGMEVATGSLPHDIPFEPSEFDLICAFDVVEHVEDDRAALDALARLLRPGGWLLTTVPAYPSLWSAHDVAHHHKRRYRRAQYVSLHREVGLMLTKVTHFNTLLLPLAVGQRVLKRVTGGQTADDALPPALLNELLARIFAAEAGLVRRMQLPAGLSLAVLARRSPPQ